MAKTIQLQDKTYNRLRTYGVVGQSFNDFVEDSLDFIDEHEEEFGTFLEKAYGNDDKNPIDEDDTEE